MGICCVDGCEPNDDVTYFPFPIKPTLRRKWREAIKTSSKLHDDSKVCSLHFKRGDYEQIRGKMRLKGRVVPSVFGGQLSPENATEPLEPNGTKEPETKKSSKRKIKNSESPEKESKLQEDDLEEAKQDEHEGVSDQEKDQATTPQETSNEATNHETASNHCGQADLPQEPIDPEEFIKINEVTPQTRQDLEKEDSIDDSTERCTIECVPEAILNHDSDSHDESDLHKEDIEDIIANYHIKQNKELAKRLKEMQEEINKEEERRNEKKKEETKEKESKKDDKKDGKKDSKKDGKRDGKKDKGKQSKKTKSDVIEIDSIDDKAPSYIEISVDANPTKSGGDDCLMVLENVEVDIDPTSLMMSEDEQDTNKKDTALNQIFNPRSRKEDPISLLTSSDDDDCILEEPHIDTVEVSDETDSDDVPLVKFVDTNHLEPAPDLGRIFWGNFYEYYCYQCKFRSTSQRELNEHKEAHLKGLLDKDGNYIREETVINVCELCNFASASKHQFTKHKKKHKDEKRFKCHLCEYKAKHKNSLMYHLKSHEGVTVEPVKFKSFLPQKTNKDAFKCDDCSFSTNNKSEMLKHVRISCVKALKNLKRYKCKRCDYKTKRRADLTRHMNRHKEKDLEDDVEYKPSSDDDD